MPTQTAKKSRPSEGCSIPPGKIESLKTSLCEGYLSHFVTAAWPILHPNDPLVWNWHIDAIADHLEACTLAFESKPGAIQRLIINIPPRMSKPVRDDMPVMTESGIKLLREIEVGDRVLTHRGRYRQVTAIHVQGELDCLKLTTHRGRTIYAEQSHPFLTPEGWVEAKDMEGRIAGSPRIPFLTDSREITHSNCLAYLAGYFVGDGATKGNSACVTCNDPTQIEHMIECARVAGFESNAVMSHRTPRVNFKGGVRSWLRECDLAEKGSHTKRIPKFVWEDVSLWGPFLGAYLACDATVNVRAGRNRNDLMVGATTVNHDLAQDLLLMFSLLGISARIRHRVTNHQSFKPGQDYWIVQICAQDDLVRLREQVFIPGVKGRKIDAAAKTRKDFDPDLLPDEVVEVKPSGKGKCRCLTVEEDESFVVNGIAVHNSMLVSVYWPAWVWLRLPWVQWLTLSHSWDNAVRDSGYMLQVITDEWYRARWGNRFDVIGGEKAAREKFVNDKRGVRQSVGISGKITGKGGHCMILDDPNDTEEANSEAYREGVARIWKEKLFNRVNDEARAVRVIIQQRCHKRDLTGVILENSDNWTHLNLPNEFVSAKRCVTVLPYWDHREKEVKVTEWKDPRETEGELLNPARLSGATLEDTKRELGSYAYGGQYQQNPTPADGGIIKREFWQGFFNPDDKGLVESFYDRRIVWDCTFKGGPKSDYVVGQLWGKKGPNYYLIDQVRGQWDFVETKKQIKEFLKKHPNYQRCYVEAKANGEAILAELRKEFPALLRVPNNIVSSGKEAQAHAVAPLVEAGNVWLPERTSRAWVDGFIEECAGAPTEVCGGDYDDQANCMTMAILIYRYGEGPSGGRGVVVKGSIH